jgi:hypothetical protein
MDTFAHGLVTYAVGQSVKSRVNWRWLVFFGVFPDLVWLPFTFIHLLTSSKIYFFNGPYNVSHSLVIWAAVSLLATIKWRQAFWYTWPWALHLLIDIPGHISMPTPILWPLSNWKIPGAFEWLTWPWLIATYAGLTVVYFVLWRTGKFQSNRRR